nr:type I-F CRISPR-associated endoribonuclease Cas6/Csy4 [Salinivibrio socompensis]
MNYYQEVTLLPDVEIAVGFLWHKVFQQVHIALAENKVGPNQSAIAVGFPDYRQGDFPLGYRLRLFAQTEAAFEQLNIQRWLSRLTDYVHIKAVKPVPEGVQDYATLNAGTTNRRSDCIKTSTGARPRLPAKMVTKRRK